MRGEKEKIEVEKRSPRNANPDSAVDSLTTCYFML